MIKRILYATDLGLYSPYLMKQLAQIAMSVQARVDILHVVEPMGVFAESIINTYLSREDARQLRQAGLQDVLLSLKKQIKETLSRDYIDILSELDIDEIVVEMGQPAEVIIQQALLRESNILVLGSHGQHAFQGGPMGSVITKVLQVSPIPVMMIPMINLGDLDRTNH
ncbi:MAG: universal stress protein [Gammaproteobacteria bacterium]|nr:universal stress protein [Gammaproteobacteria bacterium]